MAGGGSPFQARVQVFPEYAGHVPDDWITPVAERALALAAGETFDSGLAGVVIADDETVRDLNRSHRGLDETTDVLAFSNISGGRYYGEEPPQPVDAAGAFVTPPGQAADLGEVVISYPQAVRQAREAGHPVKRELATLLAHGLLHLLGYDHEDPEDEAEMTAKQEALMAEVPEID